MNGDEPPAPPAGIVYAFHRGADGQWTQQQTLESPESASGDAFGAAIAVLNGHALIGAPKATWTPDAPTEGGQANAGRRGGRGRTTAPVAAIREAGGVFEFRLENGAWQQGEEMTTRAEAEAGFGTAIAFEGDVAVIGAPGSGGGYGGAFLFTRDAGTGVWTEQSRLAAFNGKRGDRFGDAVSLDGDDLWVGAPVSRGLETGMAFLFPGTGRSFQDAPRRIRFTEMETNTEDGFGHRVVSSGGVAAVAASGVDHQAGAVFVYERDANGQWQDSGVLVSPPDALAQVSGEERRCTDGAVEQFECDGIELLAFIPNGTLRGPGDSRGVRTNDNWGWTDPQTGREYALVGRNDGTSFIDITDPVNPVLVGDLPKTPNTPRSQLWRDIKTYRNHAYIVADGAGEHGMQVFDLTRLRDVADPPAMFEPDLLYRGEGQHIVESTHNIMINEESGYAYLTSRECSGMHIIDIREPLNPTFVGCSDPGGTHDAQCLNYQGPDERYRGREICLRMSGSRFQISDVSDKANPRELVQTSHPNPTYMHQGWVTPDHRYFIMDDESDVIAGNVETTRTLIWDISDLEDPQLAREFMGSMPASAHNLYVKGDFTYQANYRYGLHILDTSDPLNPREVGSFDTSPYLSGPGFSGAWSTYPFFEIGTILVTSVQEGLFILKKRTRPVS